MRLEGLSEQERLAVTNILKEYANDGKSKSFDSIILRDWEEQPVDIDTFLHDKRYLGNALTDPEGRFTLFPYWEQKLKEIFPDPYTTTVNTLILTGAIGIGKTLFAVVCMLYMLHRLICLRDPYEYYGMQPIDKISVSMMNITIENAKGVAMDKLNQSILASEWFLAHGSMSGDKNLTYTPNKHIELIAASSNNQVIGRAIFTNFSDEVNFGLTNDVEKLKKKQLQLITQIDARMRSRFLRGTYLPTLNIIASSKNSEQSFLESYIENKKKNESKTVMIVDEAQWVVDSRKDSKEHFIVAIGNKFLANELLPLNASRELVDEYRDKGYRILEVPSGYYEIFLDNLDGALTDIAGISTASSLKYISGVRWKEVKDKNYKNPFIKEIIEVGNAKDDIAQYQDFFDLSRVPANLKAKPLYIHLDLSKSGDKTGIAGVYAVGKKPKIEGSDSSKEMFYKAAFSVSIKAPKGYEISFDKHRNFIRWLKTQGFKIKGISCDTFQSAQIAQQLQADGFAVSTISVDRLDPETKTQLQYAYFKSTVYDGRFSVYDECDFLTEEVLGLERESDGHINHPENGKQGCFTRDTQVELANGKIMSMLSIINGFNRGHKYYVKSYNETTNQIEGKLITNAWCTIKKAKLIEITLHSNEKIRCTPNHRFMLLDGSYCEAKDLKVNYLLKPSTNRLIDSLALRVKSVADIDDREDVYDLTVEDNHNFALAAGVIVHNSKDAIDAVTGALWNASLHADEFAYEYGEMFTITDINNPNPADIFVDNNLNSNIVYTGNPGQEIIENFVPLEDGILYW